VLAIALVVSSVVAVTRAQREREQRERAEAVLATKGLRGQFRYNGLHRSSPCVKWPRLPDFLRIARQWEAVWG
jgi:hypothetical protein